MRATGFSRREERNHPHSGQRLGKNRPPRATSQRVEPWCAELSRSRAILSTARIDCTVVRLMIQRAEPRSPSIDKALNILELLSGRPKGLRTVDIARELGLPKSSTHMTLEFLAARGYVSRDQNGGHRIGLKLFELGARALQALDIRLHDVIQNSRQAHFGIAASVRPRRLLARNGVPGREVGANEHRVDLLSIAGHCHLAIVVRNHLRLVELYRSDQFG